MHVFRLMEEGSPDHVIEGLNIVFVELKKFNPSSVMYKKMMVLWLRYLTEIDENTSDVPAEMLACAEIRQAIDILERSAYTDAQLDSYDDFWDGVRVSLSLDPDYRFKKGLVEGEAVGMKKGEAVGMKKGEAIGMKKGEAIGMKKGEAIGMEKGAKAKAVEMAKKMLSKGFDKQTVAEMSGLTVAEVERL
jgi:predicted transposase/invertase (TIGR01784 family)